MIHSASKKAVALASMLLLLSVAAGFAKERLPDKPTAVHPGYTFTTEEAEEKEHAAFWNRMRDDATRGPVKAQTQQSKPTDLTVQSYEGNIRITGPYFTYGSGLIEEDVVSSSALQSIKSISLRILSAAWRTVGKIAGNMSFLYGLIPSDADPATGKSYRSHSYYLRDGEYYKDGSWWVGSRLERRRTEALAWLAFYDQYGTAYARWDNNGVGEFVQNDDSCHYWDDTWIYGMTQHGYTYHRLFITEAWNECSWWNP